MEVTRLNWLITGGCGFIGTSLIAKLLSLNPSINIRVLDNLSAGSKQDLSALHAYNEISSVSISSSPAGIELLIGDIRDSDTCINACKGVDIVVHLAAQTGVPDSVSDPLYDMDVNVKGIVNMLQASKEAHVRKFIFSSSAAPLGDVPQPVHEERAPKPISPYGASKLAGEGYCSAYFRTFGLKTVSLRFGNVYGPGTMKKNSVVAKFFKKAFSNEPLEIFGDGKQTRDFIFIDDLLNAVLLSAGSETGGEVFQIATNKETTVNEIADNIRRIMLNQKRVDVKIVNTNQRQGDIRNNYSDISKARKILGYEPTYDLESGLLKTFEYFNKNYANC